MGILGYVVMGLIVGAIAKKILPGRVPGGWIATLLLGVAGAIVGGLVGSLLFNVGLAGFWSIRTWLVALAGTIVVLAIFGVLTRGARNRA